MPLSASPRDFAQRPVECAPISLKCREPHVLEPNPYTVRDPPISPLTTAMDVEAPKTADDIKHYTFVDAENVSETASIGKGDLLSHEHVDPVLNAKMHLVNNAIDEIGFTPYHWKLFVLNGFG